MTTAENTRAAGPFRGDTPLGLLLRLIAVAGLAIDVYVHVKLAPDRGVVGDSITQEQLFYAEAIGAGIVGLWLLVRGSTLAWLSAFVVGAAGVGLVVLYRYVNVGEIGPIPNMYEPIWFDDKTLSAYAEAATAVAAVIWFALLARTRRR